jgi:hypothetical protein
MCSIQKAKLQVAAVICGTVLFNLPRFFANGLFPSEDGTRVESRNILKYETFYNYFYNFALYYLFIFVIPFSMLVYMSVSLVRALSANRQRREQMTRSKKDENDMTVTLVIIVMLFLFCQILNPVRRILSTTTDSTCGKPNFYFETVTSVAILINSCANFFVYCIFSKRFRRILLHRVLHRFAAIEPTANNTDPSATHAGRTQPSVFNVQMRSADS